MSSRSDEAAALRQRYAEECGFADFAEVIAYGIRRATRIPVGGKPDPKIAAQRPPLYAPQLEEPPPDPMGADYAEWAESLEREAAP